VNYLSDKYGLVTDQDPETENGQLFLAQLLLLPPYYTGTDLHCDGVITMFRQLEKSKVKNGLYHRNPDLIDRRCMSHDNMSGIMAFLYMTKSDTRFDIWNYLVRHLGTYDNTQGKSKQLSRLLPFNPSNFFIWGLCADSKYYRMFKWIYAISLKITCKRPKEDTSGKLLTWVELVQFKKHPDCKDLWDYFENKMLEQYGADWLRELFRVYHGGNSPKFPLRQVLGI
jgi:hypothetical protein